MIAALAFSMVDLYWLVGGTLFLYAVLRWQIRLEKKMPPRRVGGRK